MAFDEKRGKTYLQAQVDDELVLRVYSDFSLLIIDDQAEARMVAPDEFTYETRWVGEVADVSATEVSLDRFKRSFEALMTEFQLRYGAMS